MDTIHNNDDIDHNKVIRLKLTQLCAMSTIIFVLYLHLHKYNPYYFFNMETHCSHSLYFDLRNYTIHNV